MPFQLTSCAAREYTSIEVGTFELNPVEYKIPGVDIDKILSQLSGDEETLALVLTFFAERTRSLLDFVRTVDSDNLSAYVIVVHGIKGSIRSIYADKAGDMAEKLEQAGKAGDYSFIKNNNDAFIAEIEKIIASIEAWLT